ncbi:sugar transferase [Paucihalobacter sp.]|uniref:sugar transferase n=2 Tax=Paucihalobacter sp. TaxID=2850405 RepID=UPI003D16081A
MYRKAKTIYYFFAALMELVIFNHIFKIILFINLYLKKTEPFQYSKRPNKNENIFYILTFKSITYEQYESVVHSSFVMWLTKFGNLIRITSLEEIIYIINILTSDMRPAYPRLLYVGYLQIYSNHQAKRRDVWTGVTR